MVCVNGLTSSSIEITNWVKSIFKENPELRLSEDFDIKPIPGDCSGRKYYSISNNNAYNLNASQKLIIMQTPIDNSMKNFIAIANFLAKLDAPIVIPTIFAIKSTAPIGYILLSHLGEKLLFKHCNKQNIEATYKLAWRALAEIQIKATNFTLPAMDRRYIKKNLLLFKEWYLKAHLNLNDYYHINNLLNTLENYFLKVFYAQPQVFVHLDYHSKNLLLINNPLEHHEPNKIGIIDFQDAMLGPITYDLVSLLQDAYLVWPEELIEKIVLDYYHYLLISNKKFNMSKQQFLRSFYLTGLQRHIKNLGIFARMKYFYKKPEYFEYIPNLINYIYNTCRKFPEPELVMIKNLIISNSYC